MLGGSYFIEIRMGTTDGKKCHCCRDSSGGMSSEFGTTYFECSLSVPTQVGFNFKQKMFQILLGVELGTLPKRPVLLKLIYCLCSIPGPLAIQQEEVLQALGHFWLPELPREASKVAMIIGFRSE